MRILVTAKIRIKFQYIKINLLTISAL